MENNCPLESFKKKGLVHRSLSLAEFSPRKATNSQQAFGEISQPCSLIRHVSSEQIFFGSNVYGLKKSFTEEVNILEPNKHLNQVNKRHDSGPALGENNCTVLKSEVSQKYSKKDCNPKEIENVAETKNRKEKRRVRHLVNESFDISKKDKKNCVLYILLPLIMVICGSLAFYLSSQSWAIPPELRVCREVIPDVTTLEAALERNIFGQKNAVNKIVDLLRIFYTSRHPEVKVFTLAGGIGVGKSYMSSLLSKYFPWQHNVKHLFWPVHHTLSASEIYKILSFCGVNLIIIDDIGISKTNAAITLVKEIIEYCKQDHIRVIIVLVFNFLESQQDSSYKYIYELNSCKDQIQKLFNMNLESEIICFENLEKIHIMKCIETVTYEKGIPWSSKKTNEVLAQLDPNTGCKGVSSKVQLL